MEYIAPIFPKSGQQKYIPSAEYLLILYAVSHFFHIISGHERFHFCICLFWQHAAFLKMDYNLVGYRKKKEERADQQFQVIITLDCNRMQREWINE